MDVDQNEYAIKDIAASLSRMWRWAGHLTEFYSVAQHCCIVSDLVSPKNKLSALLHDAAEAYILDVPRPIKRLVQQYVDLENKLQTSIAKYFKFSHPMPDEIRWADDRVLITEHRDLRCKDAVMDWENFKGIKPLKNKIIPINSDEAKQMFINYFREYYE